MKIKIKETGTDITKELLSKIYENIDNNKKIEITINNIKLTGYIIELKYRCYSKILDCVKPIKNKVRIETISIETNFDNL